MFRLTLLLIFLVWGIGEALADEIETVKSWEHYRELLILDGSSEADANAKVSRMLSSLGSMDRSAGNDRIGVATSVTFLLDKSGVIKFVHPGMEYHDPNGTVGHAMCASDMTGIRSQVERLLAE